MNILTGSAEENAELGRKAECRDCTRETVVWYNVPMHKVDRDKCVECSHKIKERWGKDYTGLCRSCAKMGARNPAWIDKERFYHNYVYVRLSSIEDKTLREMVRRSIENRSYGKRRSGICYMHHVVMIKSLGRPLEKGEEIHHIDGNKRNNSLSNLILLNVAEHRKQHRSILEELNILRQTVKTQSDLIRNYKSLEEITKPTEK